MTAAERILDALSSRESHITGRSPRWSARCPAHEDHSPSLSITATEGRALVHCHAGCDTRAVMAALGLNLADLYDEPSGVRYSYTDAAGRPTRTVHRSPDKRFRQTGTTAGMTELYRLPKVLEAVAAGTTVYLVEGEQDVHTAEALGAVATTSPMGASNWGKVDPSPLRGAHVVVVPDQDDAGRHYLDDVLGTLHGLAASVVVMRPAVGKDLTDHAAAGHTLAELRPAPVAVDDPGGRTFEDAVAAEAARLRVREAASRMVREERSGQVAEPVLIGLTEFLEVPDDPVIYRIEGLLPVGGRVILAAQYKAGKTTLRDNLVRALVDDEDFLDRFPVHRPAGRVVLFDDELDERMLRRWLREQRITNTGQVVVVALRGRVGTLDLLDPHCRSRWAGKLREVGASFVILDCLRPVLDALGLSEDKDAGRFLVGFDALLAEAGVSEAVVNHHAGHTGERSRGDSRLRDWPDVEWRLVREQADDGDSRAEARRYFSAYGRDVEVGEGLLSYDQSTRHLSLAGGNRQETAADELVPDVLHYLRANPGVSGRALELAMTTDHGHPQKRVRQAIRRGIEQLAITTRSGPRGAILHYLNAAPPVSAASASRPRQRSQSECGSASLGDALHSLPPTTSVVRQPTHSSSEADPAPAETHDEPVWQRRVQARDRALRDGAMQPGQPTPREYLIAVGL